jgi:WD40 repeat protein
LDSQRRAEAAELTARVERDKSARALQLYLLDQARQLASKGDHATATLLALDARGLQTASTAQSIVRSADRELLVAMNGLRESRLIADMAVIPASDNDVSIGGDGRRAAVVDARVPSLRLLDLESGDLIATRTLSVKADMVQYSADGERVVTREGTGVCASTDPAQTPRPCGGKAILWNGRTGDVLAEIGSHEAPVTAAGFDTGGSRLMTSAGHKTSVWNATDGTLIREVGWHMATGGNVGRAIHAHHILTLTEDGVIVVSDLETGREIRSLVAGQQNTDPARQLARPGFPYAWFTHDGQFVVASDGDLHVWRAASGEYLGRLDSDGPSDGLPVQAETEKSGRTQASRARARSSTFAIAPAGPLALAARFGEGPIILFSSAKLDYVAEIAAPAGVSSFRFSMDGQFLLVTTEEGSLQVWHSSGTKGAELAGHLGAVLDHAIIKGGAEILTAGADGTLRRWLLSRPTTSRVLVEHTDEVSMARFTADGRALVSASAAGTLRRWEFATARPLPTLELNAAGTLPRASVNSVALADDGRRLVTANGDGSVQQWDLDTGKEINRVNADAKEAYFAAISPDGARIAASGTGDTTRVWDAATMREELALRTEGGANSVMFSPDGRRLVTAHLRGTISVWDAQNGRQLATLAPSSTSIMLARFSPDGRYIASAGTDGTVRLWEAEAGRAVWSRTVGKQEVWSASFSPDGLHLVVSNAEGEISILDARTGETMASLTGHADVVTWVEYAPDGRQIISSSKDKTVRIWPVPAGGNLVARAQAELPRCLTPEQREKKYFLDPAPPRWCITMRKWPYHTEAWRKWQAEIDAGKDVPLPTPAVPALAPIATGNLR